jgi:uncharacterized membrane protein
MIWVIFRVLHIAATCASLGGLLYARMVLLPNLQFVGEAERRFFLRKMIKRYSYIKFTGIGIIAITGSIQWLHTYPTVANKEMYLLAFVIKMIGAVGLFTITALLALPNPKLAAMQNNRKLYTTISLLCGLAILIGAALMHQSHQ